VTVTTKPVDFEGLCVVGMVSDDRGFTVAIPWGDVSASFAALGTNQIAATDGPLHGFLCPPLLRIR